MLAIERRFNGPPNSGNGGYSCGLFASLLEEPAEVTLRMPPPLETSFSVERHAASLHVVLDGVVVAEVRASETVVEVPAPITLEEARASERPVFPPEHPFPTCFVCGTERDPGDGLRIFAGPIRGKAGLVAASWTPTQDLSANGVVDSKFVWAALDCPSGYAAFLQRDAAILLGRLSAVVRAPVRVGRPHVVVGWPGGADGRKLHAGSAVFDADGRLKAFARATWIARA
jgi:hypothetical protein